MTPGFRSMVGIGMWLLAAVCLSGTSVRGDDTGSPTSSAAQPASTDEKSANVTYQEPVPDDKDSSSPGKKIPSNGGGMEKAINNITTQMSEDGGTTGQDQQQQMAKASLTVTVTPDLEHLKDSWVATLKMTKDPDWSIDTNMKDSSQTQCAADKTEILSKLASWSKTLTQGQVNALMDHGWVNLNVTEPFADSQLLSKPDLVVTVRYKPVHIVPMNIYDQEFRGRLRGKQLEIQNAVAQLNGKIDADKADLTQTREKLDNLTKDLGQLRNQIDQITPKLNDIGDKMQAVMNGSNWDPQYNPFDGNFDPKVDTQTKGQVFDLMKQVAPDLLKYTKLKKLWDKDVSDLRNANDHERKTMDDLSSNEAAKTKLLQDLLDVLNYPNITQVDITADGVLVCREVYDPKGGAALVQLKQLQANVAAAQANFDKAKAVHDKAKKDYMDEAALAVAAGKDLAKKMKINAYAQYAIGTGMNTVDVVQAFLKGGLGGALAETLGKVGETATQYLIESGYDNQMKASTGVDANSIMDNINNELSINPDDPTSLASLGKTTTVDLLQEDVSSRVKKLMQQSGPKALGVWGGTAWVENYAAQNAADKYFALQGTMGPLTASQMSSLSSATDRLAKAQTRLEDLNSPWSYKAKDAVMAAGKELVKTGLSKGFQMMEESAWNDWFNHEMRSRALYPFYQMTLANYWQSLDWLQHAQDDLDAYLKQNPKPPTPYFKQTVDKNFSEGAMVVVNVTLRQQMSSNMTMEVRLGSQTLPGSPTTYSQKLPKYVTGSIEGNVALKSK